MNQQRLHRRHFMKSTMATGLAATGLAVGANQAAVAASSEPLYRISLAQWSLNKHFKAKGGELDNLDFARVARDQFKIDHIEYSSQMFQDKAADKGYLAQMLQRQRDAGSTALLIMVDNEGDLGDPDPKARTQAIENHHKWADAAKHLGCHSVRVNARSQGTWDEQLELAADGLRQLTEYGAKLGINTIVENHGGLSSNGKWLAAVMKQVDHPNVGTLPDFGNFITNDETGEEYDRYLGVEELMPYAKAVSAKAKKFDSNGEEVSTDYHRMMKIVVDSGYRGFVGIEFERDHHTKHEGIRLTKQLLERVRDELAAAEAYTDAAQPPKRD